jgi:o-succinylbenzoate---CoA ligase
MNPFPEHISLNGQKVNVREFLEKKHPPGYIKELAEFIDEWYAPYDEINAGTSGSTGVPKTIRLKKELIAQSALRTIQFFGLNAGDRILHCLPLKFIAGKLMIVRALMGKLDLFLTDPGTDFSFLVNEKFHFAAMVPHQTVKILNSEPAPGAWLQNLKHLLIGGSAIPHSLEKRLQKVPVPCYSSYGMTETATHIALRKINGEGADEYYNCLDEITVQLSAEGCLQIFMPGLAVQPFTTTDLAEVTNAKTFKISGRADNVIISGGINYSPEQLEKKLEPFIGEPFLITSLPHESLENQLVLVVEGKEHKGNIIRYREICLNNLLKYEQPKQILIIPEIPKTKNGKPDRRKVRALLLNADDDDRKSGNVP